MLYFTIGLPCLFAEWCDWVTWELVHEYAGPTHIIEANTPEELTLGLLRTGASRAVVAARRPGSLLRSALIDSNRNFVVVLEDPRLALADLVVAKGIDLPAATQAVASGCAAIMTYIEAPGALVLSAETSANKFLATATAIARHLNLSISDTEIARIVQDQAIGDPSGRFGNAESWWEALTVDQRALVDGALAGYLGSFASGQSRTVTWLGSLFFLGDRPGERVGGPIDITGRARCLAYGPAIMLPRGSWLMSLNLFLSRAALDYEFLLEIHAGHQLASSLIHPTREGEFEAQLTFTIDGAVDHPIVVRLSNQRAAFDGTINLVGLTLVPQPAPPS